MHLSAIFVCFMSQSVSCPCRVDGKGNGGNQAQHQHDVHHLFVWLAIQLDAKKKSLDSAPGIISGGSPDQQTTHHSILDAWSILLGESTEGWVWANVPLIQPQWRETNTEPENPNTSIHNVHLRQETTDLHPPATWLSILFNHDSFLEHKQLLLF